MKKRIITFIFVFLFVLMFCASAMWIGGYNFDTRGELPMLGFLFSVILAGVVGAMASVDPWDL